MAFDAFARLIRFRSAAGLLANLTNDTATLRPTFVKVRAGPAVGARARPLPAACGQAKRAR
jgi:hypothetical protein